jgi:hypothetical protein
MEQPAEVDDEIAELFPYDVLPFNRDVQLPVVIRDATVSENFTRLFFSARQYDETASRWQLCAPHESGRVLFPRAQYGSAQEHAGGARSDSIG